MPSRTPTDIFCPQFLVTHHMSCAHTVAGAELCPRNFSLYESNVHFGNCPACIMTKTAYACSCEAYLHHIITTRCTPGVQDVLRNFSQYMRSSTSKDTERHSGGSLFVKHTEEQVPSSSFSTYGTYIHIAGKSTTFQCSALIILHTRV